MAYRLQMNGGTDHVKLPSITFNKVILDIKVPRSTAATRNYFDFRSGFSFAYLQSTTGGVDSEGNDGQMSTYIDGVGPKTNNTVMVPNNVRCLLETRWGTAATDDGNIFSTSSGTNGQIGDIYDAKFYNGATLVAHYDMTLGNVQDQSGNGNHATLTGGTWVDEGGGSVDHPVTASASVVSSASATSVKGRIATATASAVTTATATATKGRNVAATAQAIASATATAIKNRFASASAQLTSSAAATAEHSSGGDYNVSASATLSTSATATVIKKRYANAAASLVTGVTASAVKGIRVTATAVLTTTASVIQGALYGQTVFFNVKITRSLQFGAVICRAVKLDTSITRIKHFSMRI